MRADLVILSIGCVGFAAGMAYFGIRCWRWACGAWSAALNGAAAEIR